MSDAKYFQTTKRGEIHELKEELHTNDKQKQKEVEPPHHLPASFALPSSLLPLGKGFKGKAGVSREGGQWRVIACGGCGRRSFQGTPTQRSCVVSHEAAGLFGLFERD